MRFQALHLYLIRYKPHVMQLLYTAGGNANWWATVENSMKISQKIKNRTTLWSRNCTSIYPPQIQKHLYKGMHPYVYCSIIYNSQTMEQPKRLSIYEWIKRMRYVYVCTYIIEYYSAIKNNEIFTFATWRELKSIMLSEISQRKTNKYQIISLICAI